jgi:hypothetical protein
MALDLLGLPLVLQAVVERFEDRPDGIYVSGTSRPAKVPGDPYPVRLIVESIHNAILKFSFHP